MLHLDFKTVLVICIFTKAWITVSNCQNITLEEEKTKQEELEEIFLQPFENEFDYMEEEEDQILNRKWRENFAQVDREFGEEDYSKEVLYEYEAMGIRKPTWKIYGHFSRLNDSYIVLAPYVARPKTVYRIVFLPYRTAYRNKLIDFKATLSTSHNRQISDGTASGLVGETTEVLLELPGALPGPHLRLRVEGSQGDQTLFVNTTLVHPSRDFLTIIVQMSRPLFNGNQKVEFRVILLKTDMLPYQEPVDVYVLDSTGYVVRRWVSRMPHIGVVDLYFWTPKIPAGGYWRIRIQAASQRKDHPFLVVKYYIPRFEIMWDMDSYTLESEEEITGTVKSYVTNEAKVFGNVTLTAYAKRPWTAPDTEYQKLNYELNEIINGELDFSISMELLEMVISNYPGTEVKIEATVFDQFTGMSIDGFAKTRIISGDVQVKFINPTPVVFRPGMPYFFVVNVAYEDKETIDPEVLASAYLRISASVTLSGGGSQSLKEIYIPPEGSDSEMAEAFMELNEIMPRNNFTNLLHYDRYEYLDYEQMRFQSLLDTETYFLRRKFEEFRESGVFKFFLNIPENAQTLTVSAAFSDAEGTVAGDSIEGMANFSPKDRHIQITTSTDVGLVGEFAVFHVRFNFPLQKFHYLIMSKGIIVHSATEHVPFSGAEGVATIDLTVALNMFPILTMVVFHVDVNGDIVADSLKLPIETFHNLEAELYQTHYKDPRKTKVETFLAAESGSYFATTCARQISYTKQPRNRLTEARIVREAAMMEPLPRTVPRIERIPRNSHEPSTYKFYTSSDGGGDALRTFQEVALAPMSDHKWVTISPAIGHCEVSLGYLECGDGTCFRFRQICDGVIDCFDGRDEVLCHYEYYPTTSHRQGIPETEEYLLLRVNFWRYYFDADFGSWTWLALFVGHGGDEVAEYEVPKTQDVWIIEGFVTHGEKGINLLPAIEYVSDPPFFLVLEGPATCRRGEQLSIRTAVFNSMEKDLIALIILPDSEDYEFIHVEKHGVVEGFRPRTSAGEHQHLLFLPALGKKELFIPLAVKKELGVLEVTVRLISQISSDEETIEIDIRPEGVPIRYHTSALLDLKSRALFYEFIDLPLDESPEITNLILRRFVYGSPEARLTLSGDVFGPINDEKSVNFLDAFEGRAFKSTDGLAFNFGATIWTLHYLRLTNQLVTSESIETFNYLNVQMAGMLTRFVNGGFKMWHYSAPSVWLTAWCTSVLSAALLEDWENYLFVDPRVLTDSVVFMLNYQHEDGYFFETEFHATSTHPQQLKFMNHGENATVALTALALSTIHEILSALPGTIRSKATQGVIRARRFLERSLYILEDPYDIAITSWALTSTGSSEKDVAVSVLLTQMRPQDGFLYWSREKIITNSRILENNQRPFLQPKEPQEGDAAAVEATSYALMTLLQREGVTLRQERIVSWLVAVRDWDFAFVSTVDTVVALKALTEYCYRARLRDVTELKVEIQASSTPEFNGEIQIEGPFVSAVKNLKVENPWGHLLITGRGSGQAIAQLTMTWGVDTPRFLARRPPRPYFQINMQEYYHLARNKSRITTTLCTSWIADDISPTSNTAMLEVEIPSGYFLHQPEANKMVKKVRQRAFPELSDCLVTDNYIYFQFTQVPARTQCFTYDLHRWHPVANLTMFRSASIYEIHTPEHFEQVILNSTVLRALDICEVCGSYQCPYCLHYSHSPSHSVPIYLIICSIILFCKSIL